MKFTRIVGLATFSLLALPALASTGTTTLTSMQDKLSYTIGADLGKNFKKQGIPINAEVLSQGIKDAQTGTKLKLTKEQMAKTLTTFRDQLKKKRDAEMQRISQANKTEGARYLSKNKAAKGVKTTASGLQYRVINAGKGTSPGPRDTVTVVYTGKLINGTVFDSNEKTKPATFRVNQLIPGWSEALQLMKPGATWEIVVPSKLAYGARGAGGPIGPNQTLIFKIQLLNVKKS